MLSILASESLGLNLSQGIFSRHFLLFYRGGSREVCGFCKNKA